MRKINEFLKSGELPKFWLGITYDELASTVTEEKLGKRWYYSSDDMSSYSYFYKGIEFMFIDNCVYVINLVIDGRNRLYIEMEMARKFF